MFLSRMALPLLRVPVRLPHDKPPRLAQAWRSRTSLHPCLDGRQLFRCKILHSPYFPGCVVPQYLERLFQVLVPPGHPRRASERRRVRAAPLRAFVPYATIVKFLTEGLDQEQPEAFVPDAEMPGDRAEARFGQRCAREVLELVGGYLELRGDSVEQLIRS